MTKSPAIPGLFVAGTDTGVGKTTISVGLLRLAARRGMKLHPFKPVETGCNPNPKDSLRLHSALLLNTIDINILCPYVFIHPVAPIIAAHLSNASLSLETLTGAARRALYGASALVVESAGGLLTPYCPGTTSADLAAAYQMPVLLIARNSLGTINHSALALAEIHRRGLQLTGLVLVDVDGENTPDRPFNLQAIHDLTGVRPLGLLPHLATTDPDAVADAVEKYLPADVLLSAALPDGTARPNAGDAW